MRSPRSAAHNVARCLLALLAAIGAGTRTLAAQAKICPPDASGVPAAGGGPKWWDNNANGVFPEYPAEDDRITDPRWSYATARSDNNTQSMFFRTIREGAGFLDLSWEYADDPSIEPAGDGVYVGFIPPPSAAPGAVNDTVVFWMQLNTNTPGNAMTGVGPLAFRKSGGVWAGAAVPPWIAQFARRWIKAGASNYAGGGGATWSWALQMRVPTTTTVTTDYTTAIRVGSGAKMFFVVAGQQGPGSGDPVTNIGWPSGLTVDHPTVVDWTFPAESTWGILAVEGGCAGGISLSYSSVGTTNVPSSQISFTMPTAATVANPNPPYNNLISNTFFIRPTNNTGSSIPGGALRGRIRVANWGIQPDWNDVGAANRSKIWQDIPIAATDSFNRAAIANASTATGANDIHFNWTVSDCEVFDMMSPRTTYPYPAHCTVPPESLERWEKRNHRCIYAEIYSTLPLDFANYSLYRNSDFVGLSKFGRDFEVTTIGYTGAKGLSRVPVYLYTTAKNMPRRISPELLQRNEGRFLNKENAAMLARAARSGTYDPRQLEEFAPTYTVRGYYGTGHYTVQGGGRHPVVKPGNSITYYAVHDGPVSGFNTTLAAREMTTLQNLRPIRVDVKAMRPDLMLVELPLDARLRMDVALEAMDGKDSTHSDTLPGGGGRDTTGGNPPDTGAGGGGGGGGTKCPPRSSLGSFAVIGGLGLFGIGASRRRRRRSDVTADPPAGDSPA